jgi:hypothetical protein
MMSSSTRRGFPTAATWGQSRGGSAEGRCGLGESGPARLVVRGFYNKAFKWWVCNRSIKGENRESTKSRHIGHLCLYSGSKLHIVLASVQVHKYGTGRSLHADSEIFIWTTKPRAKDI